MQLADEDQERRRATGQMMTMRPQERGRASVQEHGTRSAVQVNSTRHVLGIYYSDQLLILFRQAQPDRLRGNADSNRAAPSNLFL